MPEFGSFTQNLQNCGLVEILLGTMVGPIGFVVNMLYSNDLQVLANKCEIDFIYGVYMTSCCLTVKTFEIDPRLYSCH